MAVQPGAPMAATEETFRCLACCNEFHERVEENDDKERACPKCRSNSVRQLKGRKHAVKE
jgi:Zn finger protein HypA/HybF involved in hydrogenase expression